MKLCNYNYNIMSMNLLGIFTITHHYKFYRDPDLEVITISPLIYKFTSYLDFDKERWWDFRNFLNVAKIACPPSFTEKIIYRLSNPKKTMRIEFSG